MMTNLFAKVKIAFDENKFWLNAVFFYLYSLLHLCTHDGKVWKEWMGRYCWHQGLSCPTESTVKVPLAAPLQTLGYHNAAKSIGVINRGYVEYEQNICPTLLFASLLLPFWNLVM